MRCAGGCCNLPAKGISSAMDQPERIRLLIMDLASLSEGYRSSCMLGQGLPLQLTTTRNSSKTPHNPAAATGSRRLRASPRDRPRACPISRASTGSGRIQTPQAVRLHGVHQKGAYLRLQGSAAPAAQPCQQRFLHLLKLQATRSCPFCRCRTCLLQGHTSRSAS